MEQLERNKLILKKYIPEKAVDVITGWIYTFNFKLKIKYARTTKLGDYRPPIGRHNHRITINHNLNPYAFLITLVHEIAHLSTHKKYGTKAQPHGHEWKSEYIRLLYPFLNETIFPQEVIAALKSYLSNPSATVCNDHHLYRTLSHYDKKEENTIFLESLPVNAIFQTSDNQVFVKLRKLRTRYLCVKHHTTNEYLIHGLTKVKPFLNN